MEFPTDYTPGDDPVPVGTVVWYKVFRGNQEEKFEIIDHASPHDHPHPPPISKEGMDEMYPDGVAYVLWRVGALKKFGNRDGNEFCWVRRPSFRVDKEDASGSDR
jgi:hypothetical protein